MVARSSTLGMLIRQPVTEPKRRSVCRSLTVGGKSFNEQRRRLWSQIAATPARTVEGMLAKIAFASENYFGEREDLVEGTAEDLLLSAAMDYADLHGQEARS